MADRITLQVARYRPEEEAEPSFQEYEVPCPKDWVVLDGLNYIKDRLDGTLSYRWSCRMGICGSCGMTVNGEPKLTCATFLTDYAPGPVRVEPLRNFPVIRDLVVEIGDFMRKLTSGQAVDHPRRRRSRWPRASTGRRRSSWTSTSSSACASTACCATPPARSTAWTRSSSGRPRSPWPSATTSIRATRARRERLEVLSTHEGIWGCTFVGECTKVCPKHVDPAGAIQRYKLDLGDRVAQVLLHAVSARMSTERNGYTEYHPRWYRPGCPPTGGWSAGRISPSSCAS